MLHMQNPYLPASGANGGVFDWSGEISGQSQPQNGSQQGSQVTNIQVNQHQQNNNTSAPSAPAVSTSQSTPSGQSTGQMAGQTGGLPTEQASGQTAGQNGGQSSSLSPDIGGTIPTLRPQGTPAVLDMRNHLTQDQIQSPVTVDEAHMGSMKAVLGRNLGNFVVATFLVGTQGTTSWEGQLYEVGNDYLIIYQYGRDRYVVCDIYSLKYIEFYDTRRQEQCENIMRNQGWQNNGWQENG